MRSGDGDEGIACLFAMPFLYLKPEKGEKERESNERKEKNVTGHADFYRTGPAIIAGLLMQNYTDFARVLYQTFWNNFPESNQVYCRSDRPVFHHVWYYFNE